MWYVKKPIPVQALQWTGDNFEEIHNFITNYPVVITSNNELIVSTLEGDMRAPIGSYIIQGVEGEFYPCRGPIFEKTYQSIEK